MSRTSIIAALHEDAEKFRALHREWSTYKTQVENDFAVLFESLTQLVSNLETAKNDVLKDYDRVGQALLEHINMVEGVSE